MIKQIPNIITVSRIFLSLACIPLGMQHFWGWFLVVLGLAILTDPIDGWVARKLQAESLLGKRLDKIGDFTLMIGPGIGLIVAGSISWFFVVIFIVVAVPLAVMTRNSEASDLKVIRPLLYVVLGQATWLFIGHLKFTGNSYAYFLIISGLAEIALIYLEKEKLCLFLQGKGAGPFGG
ncbi:MAG: CDP-alcohol phosphatidyltransferase family protein [Patescibacteria group bacterium]